MNKKSKKKKKSILSKKNNAIITKKKIVSKKIEKRKEKKELPDLIALTLPPCDLTMIGSLSPPSEMKTPTLPLQPV